MIFQRLKPALRHIKQHPSSSALFANAILLQGLLSKRETVPLF
jgi:hypothetical protein